MKTLEVTDEQYAVIQQLREEISGQVVGKYGFVRERDAVQFLIDTLDGDTDPDIDIDIDPDADLDFSATDDVAASVGAAINGESDPNELEEVSYIEDDSVDESAADEAESEPDIDDSVDDATADDETTGADGDPDSDSDTDSEDGGEADDDDMLDEMMSLLETHDDKWGESSSADYRYSVELPDGSTEQVQTKDDVRALLFKNYR
ncbi:hypothetical protein GS429_17015 [Natronorubrum sp. JWXQ-INN-674]|uniref:Uncharacterized protein n=1 Tax=Natronorubrum halalkaliphilum TaxID=2691917 RepID=A0A6B0VT69_9EURY|nr:hypothetical protein [Natronorubrum halalkaliphilum]MXV63729.1 hypothetical protein [Natronorubrum halalkaliphilum]